MVREAIVIALIAATITLGLVVVRGIPSLPGDADAATCAGPVPLQPAVQWVSVQEASGMLGAPDVAFVDTRGHEDYEAGHITGAVHAPMEDGTLHSGVKRSLQGFRTIVAYCDASGQCARSTRFAGLLSAEGWSDVRVLEGGIDAWLAGGHPAESGECRQCR